MQMNENREDDEPALKEQKQEQQEQEHEKHQQEHQQEQGEQVEKQKQDARLIILKHQVKNHFVLNSALQELGVDLSLLPTVCDLMMTFEGASQGRITPREVNSAHSKCEFCGRCRVCSRIIWKDP